MSCAALCRPQTPRKTCSPKWERLRELKARYGTDMRNLAGTLLDDPHAADEVMHGAFRKLRRLRANELADDQKLTRVLRSIVRCMCVRFLS